jgi:hypothetical protein
VVSVPHTGVGRPMTYRSDENATQRRSPIPVGLTHGAVCLKLTWATVPPGRTQFIKPNTFFIFQIDLNL